MEDWTELTVTVPTAQADVATDIANMVVPYGVYIEDYSHLEEEAWEIAHIDLIDEDLLARDRTKRSSICISAPKIRRPRRWHFCPSG